MGHQKNVLAKIVKVVYNNLYKIINIGNLIKAPTTSQIIVNSSSVRCLIEFDTIGWRC